jgi:hypothetical protein
MQQWGRNARSGSRGWERWRRVDALLQVPVQSFQIGWRKDIDTMTGMMQGQIEKYRNGANFPYLIRQSLD